MSGWNVGRIILDFQSSLHVVVVSALEDFSGSQIDAIKYHPNCSKFEIFSKGLYLVEKLKSIKSNKAALTLTNKEKIAISFFQERKKSDSLPKN